MNARRIAHALSWRWIMARRLRAVLRLDIAAAGVGDDGVPWLRLGDGMQFYGHPPDPAFARQFYRFLPRGFRARVPFACFGVALDVEARYVRGELAWRAPRKQESYTVRPGDVVAEMGAYCGFYALRLAREVGPTGRVIAIEMMPENTALLARNVAANGIGNVTVIPKGVWNAPGTVAVKVAPHQMQTASAHLDHAGVGTTRALPVDCLDNMLAAAAVDRVDLMIIQLNGAEPEALQGLTRVRPRHLAIAARYQRPDGPAVAIVAAMLRQRGYAVDVRRGGFVLARDSRPAT